MKPKSPLLLTFDLKHCYPESLVGLLNDEATDGRVLDQIAKYHHRNETLMQLLSRHPRVMPQTLLFLFNTVSVEFKKRIHQLKKDAPANMDKSLVPFQNTGQISAARKEEIQREFQKPEERTLYQRIQSMSVAEKVQFAMRAGKDARSMLLKDPNRQVALAVLSSPKMTEDEIVLIAQSRNVSDDILRTVGKNREWLKNYSVLFALVNNPKTPPGISLPLLSMVKAKDLAILARNRNVPEAMRSGVNRLLQAKQKQS
jgi:hypothetical protein